MEVQIERLGINGEGIFKCQEGELLNKVGFVSFALPGESVEVEILKNKSNFVEAKLNKVNTVSPHRKNPECPYFYKCGGCDVQHMDKVTEHQFKKSKVEDTIRKIAKLGDFKLDKIVDINDFHYRNKMVFPFGMAGNECVLGMYEKNSRKIVNIDFCLLANEKINEILRLSKEFFENSKKYIEFIKSKTLKHLVVRSINDKSLITIVSSKKVDLQDYCDYVTEKLKNIGISQIIGDSDDEILSGKYTYLTGIENIEIEEFGLKYSIDNRGFLQVNNEIKKEIYSQILEWISDTDNVIDAYSGAGLLSGIISKKCKSVIGIEINQSASKSAQNMSKFNGLHNTMFVCDDVKNRIAECLNQNSDPVLILDPARSGCESVVLDKILESNLPKKIIYLSCNVATLARDLIKLKNYYTITSSIGYNMFPNTKHIETLVCLQRRV